MRQSGLMYINLLSSDTTAYEKILPTSWVRVSMPCAYGCCLTAYDISAEDIINALRRQNVEAVSGKIGESSGRRVQLLQYVLRYTGKFEAQLLHTRSLQYELQQQIVPIENALHFLAGRFPQQIPRAALNFSADALPSQPAVGIPSALLQNRPDIC